MLIPLILCSGCWSRKEVENLAFVTLTGMDYAKVNGKEVWTVSSLILDVQGTQGQGDQSASQANKEIFIIGQGPTQQTAIVDYANKLARTPFYGYISGYIFGEEAAKEKLGEIIENLNRYFQTRPLNIMTVTKGEAQDMLKKPGTVNRLLSQQLTEFTEYKATASGKSVGVYLYELTSWLVSPDRDAVLGEVKTISYDAGNNSPEDEPAVEANIMDGIGVFRAGKLIDWLNDDQVRGYLLLTQKLRKSQISLPVETDNKTFSYYIGKSDCKIEPKVEGDKVFYRVTIKVVGEIDDNAGVELSPQSAKPLEAVISDKIKKLAEATIEKAKDNKADYLGFSEVLHQKNPKFWKTLGPEWREAFVKSDVEVIVKAKVMGGGKLLKNLEIGK
ncbi:Ger(x)C family spore germination protein [Dehalobacter sp. DCM]|nr:Ger(x)C family spore germination protein [Dehalobacter sp. DCM]